MVGAAAQGSPRFTGGPAAAAAAVGCSGYPLGHTFPVLVRVTVKRVRFFMRMDIVLSWITIIAQTFTALESLPQHSTKLLAAP